MKFGRLIVNFARDTAPAVGQEVGTALPFKNGYLLNGEAIDTSKLKISDFVKMRQNDGTASALYNILTLPILSLTWDIKPDPDDTDSIQATFVEDALRKPPHKGGMSTPMSLVLADMLRAVLEGYRLFEKVYELNADGKVVYAKIAPRDNQTLTLRLDDRGGFNGAKQAAMFGSDYRDVVIPVERCFLFTYGKDKNFIFGESAFIAAYQHYDEKRKLYYLGRLAAQALSIPPKVAKAPKGAKQDQMDGVAAALNNLVGVNSATVLPDGFGLENVNLSSGKFDVMGLIDHHNAEMARSVLAHFLMLGTQSSGSGSWALSSDQSDMFIMALKGLVKNMEEHITSYLIPDLINYNFDSPKFPRFEFAEMTDSTIGMLKEAFLKILDKVPQGIPDYLIEGIVDKLADQLDIERPDGEAGKTRDIAKTATAVPAAPAATPAPVLHDSHKGTNLDDMRWSRPLTPIEERVNFAGIENKYNKLEQDFTAAITPIWQKLTDDAIAGVQALIDAGKTDQLNKFELVGADEYKTLIVNTMLDGYNYAKTGAADELGKASPATPKAKKDLIDQMAQAYVDKQYADLTYNIRTTINEALRNNELSETQFDAKNVLASIGAMFAGFLTKNAEVGISAAVAAAVNLGRDTVFETYDSDIESYEYSAVLDRKTCPICEDLDGSVVDAAEYKSSHWHPPIHFHCRCLWVAILKTETDKPFITGLPTEAGGESSPLLDSPAFNFSMQYKHAVVI